MCIRSCWLVLRESKRKWMPNPGKKKKNQCGISEATVNTIHRLWPWMVLKMLQLQYVVWEDWKKFKLLCNWHKHTFTHVRSIRLVNQDAEFCTDYSGSTWGDAEDTVLWENLFRTAQFIAGNTLSSILFILRWWGENEITVGWIKREH